MCLMHVVQQSLLEAISALAVLLSMLAILEQSYRPHSSETFGSVKEQGMHSTGSSAQPDVLSPEFLFAKIMYTELQWRWMANNATRTIIANRQCWCVADDSNVYQAKLTLQLQLLQRSHGCHTDHMTMHPTCCDRPSGGVNIHGDVLLADGV